VVLWNLKLAFFYFREAGLLKNDEPDERLLENKFLSVTAIT
jgi:hypothetical protein